MTDPALRVAVAGVGPKGFYCLERLAIELVRAPASSRRLEVHMFEPHPHPGAGPVYDLRQPDYLRMNFANRHVDIWSRPGSGLPFPRHSLTGWLALHFPALADPYGYAPRRIVGEYLHDGFLRVVDCLRRRARVILHPHALTAVTREGERWRVRTAADEVAVDEVLIATGHGSRVKARVVLEGAAAVVSSVFPVDQPGGLDEIAPGSAVALRGFGLTALDAALALTEGRGGCFEWDPSRVVPQYRPSGREVRSILPFSRTGRPMVPKPDGHADASTPELDDVWASGLEALEKAASAGDSAVDEIFSTLSRTADRALDVVLRRPSGRGSGEARSYLDRVSSGPVLGLSAKALEERMTRSLEMAVGERPPDVEWALGSAWRNLYPGLERLVAAGRIRGRAWSPFDRLAREMERVAFGPPAENAARYLALMRAGIVDLSVVTAPEVRGCATGVELSSGGVERAADVLVDAVLAPPGAAPRSSALLRGLLDSGHLRTLPWNSGAEVTADGACVGRSGEVTPGLSMVGRPTEGCVLGNDTLSRTLHATPKRWAQAVARRFREPVRELVG